LEVLAEDNNGISSQQEIQIAVGDVPETSQANWRDEIHQVILKEDEKIMTGDVRVFQRLECYLTLEDDGKLVFYNGSPDNRGKSIWGIRGKDTPHPHYATLENGQLVVYRGTPEYPEAILFSSSPPRGTDPCMLGITVSKKLVVFQEGKGKEKKIVWNNW
jgi:hypothetical protein